MHITWGQATDTGLVRKQNEDAVFTLYMRGDGAAARPNFGIFIVVDGMGDKHEALIASQIAVQTISQVLLDSLFNPIFETGKHPPINYAITSAIQEANARVLKEASFGGATATAAVIVSDDLHIGHVGDTAAIIVKQDSVVQLTQIHDFINKLIELGEITWEDVDKRHVKNVIYRAVGQREDLDIDIIQAKLIPNSYLMLCSDGLTMKRNYNYWKMPSEMKAIILNTPDPQQACDKLIAFANAEGGIDNTSVIVIKVSE
jgi:PPM family protein phosphatase